MDLHTEDIVSVEKLDQEGERRLVVADTGDLRAEQFYRVGQRPAGEGAVGYF